MNCSAVFRRHCLCIAVLALGLAGCDRPRESSGRSSGAASQSVRKTGVTYQFAAGLREQYAEIVSVMQQFLETCLAGDYDGYRTFIATSATPDSHERFDAAFQSLQSLTVDRVEQRAAPELGLSEVWLVHWTAKLDPQSNLGRRKPVREVEIIVHREGGQWRLQPAPPSLRTHRATSGPSAETQDAGPDYPWDTD